MARGDDRFTSQLSPGDLSIDRINIQLRRLADRINSLQGRGGQIQLRDAIKITSSDRSTFIDMADQDGGAGSLSLSPGSEVLGEEGYDFTNLAVAAGAIRNDDEKQAGWIPKNTSASVLLLDRTGYTFNWNQNLVADEEFAPLPVMKINGENLLVDFYTNSLSMDEAAAQTSAAGEIVFTYDNTATGCPIFVASPNGAPPEPVKLLGTNYVTFEEDFYSGAAATQLQIGTHGWTVYASAVNYSVTQSTLSRGSGWELMSTATMAAGNILSLYHQQSAYPFLFKEPETYGFKFHLYIDLNTTAANRSPVFFGLTEDVTFGGAGAGNLARAATAHLGFLYDPSLSTTNWYVSGSNATNRTQSDTGVAISNPGYVTLEMIQISAGTWNVYINDTYATQYTSYRPSTSTYTQVIPAIESNATASQRVYVDYIRFIQEAPNR